MSGLPTNKRKTSTPIENLRTGGLRSDRSPSQDNRYDQLRGQAASTARRVLDHEEDYPSLLTIFEDGNTSPQVAAYVDRAAE